MSEHNSELTLFGKIVKGLIPLIFVIGGGGAWYCFMATAPVMKKAIPQRQVAVVELRTAEQEDARLTVSVMGTVAAAREVTLKARVAGTVQSVCDRFVPGSLVQKGDTLFLLDSADYKVAVDKAASVLADAKAALTIEQGSQNIAKAELQVLNEITDRQVDQTDLALRKPQLAQALADVISAEADLSQARLNLSRTKITAPFNAIIVERSANVGTYVGTQDSLVTLAGADEFWVKAAIPLDQIPYMDMNRPGGCPARISSQTGAGVWEGYVLQTTGKLNESSRMASVIVVIKNPLGSIEHPASFPLMIDDYVHVDITGRTLTNVIVLPRTALKENNTVWIYDAKALNIRKVTVAWKDEKNIYVQDGLTQGEQVIVSDIATPVQGMALQAVNSLVPEEDTAKVASNEN